MQEKKVQRKMRRIMFLMMATVVAMADCSIDGKSEKEKQLVFSRESKNVVKIMERLFHNGSYNKNVRPYIADKAVVIKVLIGVNSISEISEENMEFKCTMYIRQTWHDPRLVYGDDNTTIILEGENLEKIWLPDTYIDNARKTTVDKQTSAALLYSNGTVYYSYRESSTLGSIMNFLNYPMDEQKLYIHMNSYFHTEEKIKLKWQGGSILNKELATYIFTDEVTLLEKSESFVTGTYSILIFQFEIHRRLGYFLMQFYFPCVLSVLVSWLPFWMDRYEIGDRVSLGITTLLTEVFLSQYINSAMPRVSYIKAADEFLLASFVFIMMALIESVVVYNVRQDVRERRVGHQSYRQRTQGHGRNGSTKNDAEGRNGSTKVTTEGRNGSTKVVDDHTRNGSTKEFENPAFEDDVPEFSIINVFRANFKRKNDDDEVKTKDLGRRVDNISRVAFPFIYLLFISYYFGRYALYNKLIHNN